MDPALNIGIRAARRAGDLIIRYMEAVEGVPVSSKGRNDFVSDVDWQAEAAIIETIRKAYPTHGILAEEGGAQAGDECQWIIDPLDGTTNYLHGFPQFAVSIALKVKERLEQAVVYDPLRQELFTASRGKGALLNDRRIRVSRQPGLEGALLGTGFPFRGEAHLDRFISIFRALFPIAAGIRRAGAASLDLAYVGCGRLDGFWEFGLKQWDIAAGHLLICEAGGLISSLDGHGDCLETGNVLAGNPHVYKAMLKVLAGINHEGT
ncbi:MAG: inositol monophosphatase family protein, partial [Gammaproteobacteria bacterium]